VPRNSRYLSREKAARREGLLAAIGRRLREHYAGVQPRAASPRLCLGMDATYGRAIKIKSRGRNV
jgi:hypothetical protein